MAYTKWGYTVEGAYSTPESIDDRAGVYIVYCKMAEIWTVIDVGESATVMTRLLTHERKKCWERVCYGSMLYSVIYTPDTQQAGRMGIEQKIRAIENPICGDR